MAFFKQVMLWLYVNKPEHCIAEHSSPNYIPRILECMPVNGGADCP